MNGKLEPMILGGAVIRDHNEMVNLTDMWRAAGSDPQKHPAKWLALVSTIEFIDHFASNLDLNEVSIYGNAVVRERMIGMASAAKVEQPRRSAWKSDDLALSTSQPFVQISREAQLSF